MGLTDVNLPIHATGPVGVGETEQHFHFVAERKMLTGISRKSTFFNSFFVTLTFVTVKVNFSWGNAGDGLVGVAYDIGAGRTPKKTPGIWALQMMGFYLSLREMAQTPKVTFDFFLVKMCRPRLVERIEIVGGNFRFVAGGNLLRPPHPP